MYHVLGRILLRESALSTNAAVCQNIKSLRPVRRLERAGVRGKRTHRLPGYPLLNQDDDCRSIRDMRQDAAVLGACRWILDSSGKEGVSEAEHLVHHGEWLPHECEN